jgi:plasmid maintenance system antidote protein VapI
MANVCPLMRKHGNSKAKRRHNMAGKRQYSDAEVDEFIELAQMKGIAPAIRELGWPSFPTAQKWFREKGYDMPNVDSLMQKAAELRVFYGDNEKKASIQITIDRIIEMIHENAGLTADDINKLSNALAKLLQTFQLIEGKSTSVTEKVEKNDTDRNIERLMAQMKNMNKAKEEQIG